jgi:hypothetical protein
MRKGLATGIRRSSECLAGKHQKISSSHVRVILVMLCLVMAIAF